MPTLFLHFNRLLTSRYPERYSERLASLLQLQLAMLTGLNLGKDCWFMFQVRNTIQARRDVFVASGDLIGPDSCGYHAEITWQEERGVPSCATWTGLPVPDFVSHYGRVRPKTVPLR